MEICSRFGRILKEGISSPREYLEEFCKPVPLNKTGNSSIAVLNFSLSKGFMKIEQTTVTEANVVELGKQHLWVGNTPDKDNRYITTNNFESLFIGDKIDKKGSAKNKNVLALLQLQAKETPLGTQLETVIKTFYPPKYDGFFDLTRLEGYSHFLDLVLEVSTNWKAATTAKQKKENLSAIKKLIPLPKEESEIKTILDKINSRPAVEAFFSELVQESTHLYRNDPKKGAGSDNYFSILAAILGSSLKEIVLATVSIDNSNIVDSEDYLTYLHAEKSLPPSPKAPTGEKLLCSTCGVQSDEVSAEMLKKTSIKFFMTDKRVFAANLEDSFSNNFSICNDCLTSIRLGERFLLGKCKSFWAGKPVLFVPEITPAEGLDKHTLEEIGQVSSRLNEALYNISDRRDVERDIEDLLAQIGKRSIIFHYIFHNTDMGGHPNKIHKIIKDVPPTRLREIILAIKRLTLSTGIKPDFPVDLHQIYYCIPVTVDKKKALKGKGIIFDLFDAILLKMQFPCRQLVEQFAKTQRILLLGTAGYNLSSDKPEYNIRNTIQKTIMMNEILAFLEQIGSIRIDDLNIEKGNDLKMSGNDADESAHDEGMGDAVIASSTQVIEDYWKNKGVYRAPEARAMFLLGTMIADVGSAQFKNGVPGDPILKKVNFDGMNRSRIVNLSNDIVERLIKYKVYAFNKGIHAAFQGLVDSVDEDTWSLLPAENVFYIMSGFAFKRAYVKSLAEKKKTPTTEETKKEDVMSEKKKTKVKK